MSLNIEDLLRVKVYSASRHLEEVRKAPSAVTIITAQQIRNHGWRTLGEALQSQRGFYISYDRQYTYLGVRGFLRPGDYNSRILVLLNGHRVNENVYGSAPIGTEVPLDLDLVDHIEVVRGPGSSLFGTNAMFGVVNIITRSAREESGIEVSGEASSFYGRDGRITLAGQKGRLSGLIAGRLSLNPGQDRLFFPEFASPETNNGYAEGMDGARIGQIFADVRWRDLRLQGLVAQRSKKFPTGSYGTVFNDPRDAERDTRGYVDASYQRHFASKTDLDARVFYDAYTYLGTGDYQIPGATIQGIGRARADWVGTDVNVSRKLGTRRFTIGGNYEYSIGIQQRNYSPGLPDLFNSKQSSWLAALYGEFEFHAFRNLKINAGGRLDWYSTFGRAVSPRVAFIYLPSDRAAFKYILGKSFRAPNAYEEYYADGITVAPAPVSLKPEQVLSHEALGEYSVRPWLTFTADFYYNQLKKLIDQEPAPDAGLSYFVNDGSTHAKGAEFEAEAHGQSGWEAGASWSLSRATDDLLHTALENSPQNNLKVKMTAPLFKQGFAGAELIYSSAMESYRGTRVPPYALTNITFTSRPVAGGWNCSAGLYNAFDRRFFSPMGPNDPEAAIQQDGRTFRFKITYRLAGFAKPRPK